MARRKKTPRVREPHAPYAAETPASEAGAPIRVPASPELRTMVETAAVRTGQTVEEYAASALYRDAHQVLEGHTTLLTARDWERFWDLVENPAAPNEALGRHHDRASFHHLPEPVRRRLPRHPVPTVRLARLAVDRSARGRRLGEALLFHALGLAVEAVGIMGAFAVEVYAKHDQASAFYRRFGFAPMADDTLHLYLPISAARTLL